MAKKYKIPEKKENHVLNPNLFWAIDTHMVIEEDEIKRRGYINKFVFQEELPGLIIAECYFTKVWTKKKGVKNFTEDDASIEEGIFPITNLKYSNEDIANALIEASEGILKKFEFIRFKDRSEMMKYVLD